MVYFRLLYNLSSSSEFSRSIRVINVLHLLCNSRAVRDLMNLVKSQNNIVKDGLFSITLFSINVQSFLKLRIFTFNQFNQRD